MKKPRQNNNALISKSRWLGYAAAGAASTLAGARSAEAEIHYSGLINKVFSDGNDYIHASVPLNNGLKIRFSERTYSFSLSIGGAPVSNSFCGYYFVRFGSTWVYRLHRDAKISNYNFYSPRGLMLFLAPYSGASFFSRGTGYIGFRFNKGAGTQYGWIRVRMPGPPYIGLRFTLVDWAWGDPGDRIKAGQTSSAGDQLEAIPDQGSLGLLALGGAGLIAWRQRRAKIH